MACFVHTGNIGIKETFGRFTGVLKPGVHFYVPFVEKVNILNTQVNQMKLQFNVRTKDNAFVYLDLAVQYKVANPELAFYSLRSSEKQMKSYAENIIRSKVPTMTLSKLFEDKDELCKEVKNNMKYMLDDHGYVLTDTLITNVDPDPSLKNAMNQVLASEHLKKVAENESEAARIRSIKEAEADKERKRLQGEGIAEQRAAILNGYKTSIGNLSDKLGISSTSAMQLSLFSQYFDTLKDMSKESNTKTIFVPYSSTHPTQIFDQFRDSLMQGNEVGGKTNEIVDTKRR